MASFLQRWRKRALDRILPPAEQERVVTAIATAELGTTGEIKVHVERHCPGQDPYRRAVALFGELGLTKTRDRNAVLIYLAIEHRRFALIGDTAIHAAVGDPFWQAASVVLRAALVRGAYGEGLAQAVTAVGQELAQRFPRTAEKTNEIDDSISS